MKTSSVIFAAAIVLAGSCCEGARAGELLAAISQVATGACREQLAGQSFDIPDNEHVRGVATFPNESLEKIKSDVTRCTLKEDTATVAVRLTVPCRLAAKVLRQAGDVDFVAEPVIKVTVSGQLKLEPHPGKPDLVQLVGEVAELDAEVSFEKIIPPDVVRNQEDLETILNDSLRQKKKKLIASVNQALAKQARQIPIKGTPAGEDNPWLRLVVQSALTDELGKHATEAAAWYAEATHRRKKEVLLTITWTERTRTWVWLPDSAQIDIKIQQLELTPEGRVAFSAVAAGPVAFRLWGEIEGGPSGELRGTATTKISVKGSFALGEGGRVEQAALSELTSTIDKLKFENEVVDLLAQLLVPAANEFLKNHNQKYRRELEGALNRCSL
jgi:hypothetical protein